MASLELGTCLGFDGVLYVMLFSNSGYLYKVPCSNALGSKKGEKGFLVATIAYINTHQTTVSLNGDSVVLATQLPNVVKKCPLTESRLSIWFASDTFYGHITIK